MPSATQPLTMATKVALAVINVVAPMHGRKAGVAR